MRATSALSAFVVLGAALSTFGPSEGWAATVNASAGVGVAVRIQPSEPMETVYGRTQPLEVEARGGVWWQERLGVGGLLGFSRRDGVGIGPGEELPATVLWQIPVAFEGRARLALRDDQPVVPVIRGGLGVVVVHETWSGGSTSEEGGWAAVKATAHIAGGAQIRLPFPELGFGGPRFTTARLPRAVYLQFEGRLRSAGDFGRKGLDLSDAGVVAGLTIWW